MIERAEAELAIIHDKPPAHPQVVFSPLFRYESVALIVPRHRLAAKSWLDAADFANETLITYPVPDEMLDVTRHCLSPAGINPQAPYRGVDGCHPAARCERPGHCRAAVLDGRQLYRTRLCRIAADRPGGTAL